MQTRRLYISIAAALLVCLGLGLLFAVGLAPTPIVGVINFSAVIDDASAQTLTELVGDATADPAVAAVVLRINSPGGYATSSENLFHDLLNLRRAKPLVVFIDGLAASGGYYMAVAANRIYAPASSYVGNVGTRGGRPVDPFIYPDELSSGPYKLSGGSRFDQIRQLDLVAQSFISNVVAMRSIATVNPLKIDAAGVAEARIYLGSEAQAIGYIDAQGGLSDAIAGAAELAGLGSYRTLDLEEYFGLQAAPIPTVVPLADELAQMAQSAPPDAVYMLDDRLPLPARATHDATLAALRRLRATAPSPFNAPPESTARSSQSPESLP